MSQTYLSNKDCDVMEEKNLALQEIPGKIKSSVGTFRYAINEETISEWILETEIGASLKKDLEKYCDSLEKMADIINGLYQDIDSLIINSRRNNQK